LTTTNKALSYALRSLYPGAFASYQGVVFRVIGPEQTALSGVSADNEQTFSMVEKLATPEGKALMQKAAAKIERQIHDERQRNVHLDKLRVIVPKKLTYVLMIR
jgi:hypothetical protein